MSRQCDAFSIAASEILDRRRHELRWTILRLAAAADVSYGAACQALDGRTATTATYARLAAALGCDLSLTLITKPS